MVVIVLAAIVIASSAGIYFLLRYGEPTPADRASRRRKYSIRRRGLRTHPLPIGLPGSLSEKIGSVFKGRRAGAGAGWVPARDDDDGDDYGEWDTTDEPLRVRAQEHHAIFDVDNDNDNHDGEGDGDGRQRDEYLRVGSTPASRLTVLSESTMADTHRSRDATLVEAGAETSPGLLRAASPAAFGQIPARATSVTAQVVVPDEEWLDAGRDTTSSVGRGSAEGGHANTEQLAYYAPQPRRADSGQEIPLFAGSVPFR